MAHSKEQNKPTETVYKKNELKDLLDKDFKTIILKMLKELKEDVEKVNYVGIK